MSSLFCPEALISSVLEPSIVDICRVATGQLTVEGSNFGDGNAVVLVGSGVCSDVQHDALSPSSKLQCKMPQGVSRGVVSACCVVLSAFVVFCSCDNKVSSV